MRESSSAHLRGSPSAEGLRINKGAESMITHQVICHHLCRARAPSGKSHQHPVPVVVGPLWNNVERVRLSETVQDSCIRRALVAGDSQG
jgi:hypothetical protein